MNTEALVLREDVASPALTSRQVIERVDLIQKIKESVMQPGVHYGTLPGTQRASLWQAGAEVLKVAFGISVRCEIAEERITDEEIFYRVRATAYSREGQDLGAREAVCSTREKKYRWRRPVHIKEWEAADAHMRRITWDKEGNEIPQVRTDPGDLIETILAMANKRADVALTRAVTGCSDMFEVDWEGSEEDQPKEPVRQPAPASETSEQKQQELPSGAPDSVRITACKKVKSGETDKGPWTLYSIKTSDGKSYGTFSLSLFGAAQKALNEEYPVRIAAVPGKEGHDPQVEEIIPVMA